MRFKYDFLESEWPKLDVRLREIIIPVFQLICGQRSQPTLVVTSIHRQDGVHATWRAVDIRNPWMREITVAEELATWINSRFIYGKTSKGVPTHVCIVGKFDPNGKHLDHFHFQVPGEYVQEGGLNMREVVIGG